MGDAQRKLEERVKELTALHACARALREDTLSIPSLLEVVVRLLPPAFQFPLIASAAIVVGDAQARTEGDADTEWSLRVPLEGQAPEERGELRVSYREAQSFLFEEKVLLTSIAEMLSAELQRRGLIARLESERQRLQLALTVAEMGIWELDAQTRRVRWSADLARFIGHTGGDLYGDLFEFAHHIHEDDRERIKVTLNAALADPAANTLELSYRLARPEGGWREVQGNGRIFRDAGGKAIRLVATIADVTKRRALEAQVRQQQKLEAMGLVAGSVAHDFNNLLTVILSTGGMLHRDLPPGDAREMAGEMVEAGKRGSALTRQLLAFGRKSESAPMRVLLSSVLKDIEPILSRLLKPSCSLSVDLCPEPLEVWADSGQLDQLVMNLAVNARDAMAEKGGGPVTISVRRAVIERDPVWTEARVGPAVELAVSDAGTGIPPEVLPRLFEPFFTTKPVGKGTGLGLAVVFGVVKQCNGALRIDTAVGKGTTFRALLPLHS